MHEDLRDYARLFRSPYPRFERARRDGRQILRRSPTCAVILPADDPVVRALFLDQLTEYEYRDYRVAMLRRRWPDRLEGRDLVELDEFLSATSP